MKTANHILLEIRQARLLAEDGDIEAADSGDTGKGFEAAFVKGLKAAGLRFAKNRASGAVWAPASAQARERQAASA